MFASTEPDQSVVVEDPTGGTRKRGRQTPPPRLLLDQDLQILAINAYLLQLCSIDTDACRGVSIEEWVNADAALLTRIKACLAGGAAPWHEVFTVRLSGGAAVSALLKLTPLRGRSGPGLLVTMREIRLSGNRPAAVTLVA